jgi:hypothetical protein
MRGMRRRRRAREEESAAGPPFGEDVPPWPSDGPEQWFQKWVPPRVEDRSPPAPGPVPGPAPTIDVSAELVRLLEVVTTMCDHVIGFVEADREDRQLAMQADRDERRAMVEALSLLIGRMGDAPVIAAPARERAIGGSMSAGPATSIDLRDGDDHEPGAPAIHQGSWSAAMPHRGERVADPADPEGR